MSLIVLFNKPYGVLCQFSAQPGRRTLKDFLPQSDIYPAGRLDADSEGLVLLTADGSLQHRISEPGHDTLKMYFAQVEGAPAESAMSTLRSGVPLREFTTRKADARATAEPSWLWPRVPPIRERRAIPTAWLEIGLREGKNRQVRRMTAAVGLPTLRLIRYAVGPWDLEGLPPGAWRQLDVTADAAGKRATTGRQPIYRGRR